MSTTEGKQKRRIMRSLKLLEISAVDRPANEHARMVLMKRADDPGAAAVPAPSADNPGTPAATEKTRMADKTAAGDQSAELAKRDDQIAKLEAVVALSSEHRAHYDTLPLAKQEDFLTSSEAAREQLIETAKKADPVVYTAKDGAEYRKSDDPRLVQMAKDRDADREATEIMKAETQQARYEKRIAEELDLIPGEPIAKVALLRAIDTIEDAEVVKQVRELIAKANKVFKMAMTTYGVTAGQPSGEANAAAQLKQLAEKRADEKGIPFGKAYSQVLETSEGMELYRQHRAERGN